MAMRAFRLPAQEKTAILLIHAAARRIAVRHFDAADAVTAAFYWTGFHATNTLNLPSALVRTAIALDEQPIAFLDRMVKYHALNAGEPARCEEAYQAFLDCYRLMGGDPR